jgi:hypothetical protein
MSFIHKYLVGHFDLYAFSAAAPAVLRPVDVARARRMLEAIGQSLTQEQLAAAFSFGDGRAECVWSALGDRFEVARAFACALAQVEGCIVVEVPGTVVYPPGAARPCTDGDEPLSADSAEPALARNDVADLRRALYRAPLAGTDARWMQAFCAQLARHAHYNVRGNAMFTFGVLARRGHDLDRPRVQPLIEGGLVDGHAYVRRQAEAAARVIEMKSGWLFPYFDNGKPEVEVTTYANGWVRCPACGWRFATYDPWAFREGRCMTCRQRLRVVQPNP